MRDLFILHADADADATFVRARLVPELGLEPEQVLLSSELPEGVSIIQAIEDGVTDSRVTVAVVSPTFLHDRWAVFGETLAGHHAVRGGVLVPLLLFDCAVPLRLDFRVKLDCRDERHRTAEIGRLRAMLELPEPPAQEIPCPYPGLRPYASENAGLFCGRDRDVDDLVRRIAGGCRELYVVGPSGCGKSSLLLSGVVPRLERAGDPAVGERFEVRVFRPGELPAVRLAAAIGSMAPRSAPDGTTAPAPRTLVVVDQLEEIFTLARRDARRDFFAALDELRADPTRHLVFSLRADFLGALMQSALWPQVRRSHRHELEPLRGDDLRTAITVPARRVGVELEPSLVYRLLADAADEPGSLPLIQESLVHLWAKRERNLLTAAAYAELGDGDTSGLAAALSRRADRVFGDLDAAGQAVARRIFLRLVSFGDGRPDTRRQQPLSALRAGEDPERLAATVRHLTEHRLLTADGDEPSGETLLDLAHETLIASWPKMRDWIRTFRKHEQQRRKLEAEAAEWIGRVAQDRHDVGLHDAGQLAELRGWLTADATRDLGLSGDVRAFLAASEAAVATKVLGERARRRRWRRWVTVALVVLATAVVAVSILAVIVERQSREVGKQKRIAEMNEDEANAAGRNAKELARQTAEHFREAQRQLATNYVAQGRALLLDGRGQQAAPYLFAARDLLMRGGGADADVPLRALFRWATRDWPLVTVVHAATVYAVAWSPDGTRLATASGDKTAQVWDARTGKPMSQPLVHVDEVNSVRWSPDGKWVATVSDDKTARVWDANTGDPVSSPLVHQESVLALAWSPDSAAVATISRDEIARVWQASTGLALSTLVHRAKVNSVTWSPDGKWMATASDDMTAQLWDARTGRLLSALKHKSKVRAVAWSPDSKRVATASEDGAARVWNVGTAQLVLPLLKHDDIVYKVAWSPDGKRLATASRDETAQVWDARTGRSVGSSLDHDDDVWGVTWSPDGKRLATASRDGTARVWDASSGLAVSLPLEHQAKVAAVSWSPDGKQLATASLDKTARVWDVESPPPRPLEHNDIVWRVEWSPDGNQVGTASDNTAHVWDAHTGTSVPPPLAHRDGVYAVAWRPDGKRVAVAIRGKTAWFWDTRTMQPVVPLLKHADIVGAAAWNRDRTRLATASGDKTVRVWDTSSGDLVSEHMHDRIVHALAWSPDSRRLAFASGETALVWEVSSPGQLVPPLLAHQDEVVAVAWSPDGAWLATASGKTAQVWDARSGAPVSRPLKHRYLVNAVAWSADSTRLATASDDETAKVWDARTGQPVSPSLEHTDIVNDVAWSPDGMQVATASDDKTTRVWDVSWDTGTLEEWRTTLQRCPYEFNKDGVLVARDPKTLATTQPPRPSTPASP